MPTEVGVKLAIERGDTAPSYSTSAPVAEPTPPDGAAKPRQPTLDDAQKGD